MLRLPPPLTTGYSRFSPTMVEKVTKIEIHIHVLLGVPTVDLKGELFARGDTCKGNIFYIVSW